MWLFRPSMHLKLLMNILKYTYKPWQNIQTNNRLKTTTFIYFRKCPTPNTGIFSFFSPETSLSIATPYPFHRGIFWAGDRDSTGSKYPLTCGPLGLWFVDQRFDPSDSEILLSFRPAPGQLSMPPLSKKSPYFRIFGNNFRFLPRKKGPFPHFREQAPYNYCVIKTAKRLSYKSGTI